MNKKLISPYQKNAFSEPVLYEVVKEYIDFNLDERTWEAITDVFAECWNDHIGVGGDIYPADVFDFVKKGLQQKGILIPNRKLGDIVYAILNFLSKVPGTMVE